MQHKQYEDNPEITSNTIIISYFHSVSHIQEIIYAVKLRRNKLTFHFLINSLTGQWLNESLSKKTTTFKIECMCYIHKINTKRKTSCSKLQIFTVKRSFWLRLFSMSLKKKNVKLKFLLMSWKRVWRLQFFSDSYVLLFVWFPEILKS